MNSLSTNGFGPLLVFVVLTQFVVFFFVAANSFFLKFFLCLRDLFTGASSWDFVSLDSELRLLSSELSGEVRLEFGLRVGIFLSLLWGSLFGSLVFCLNANTQKYFTHNNLASFVFPLHRWFWVPISYLLAFVWRRKI